MEGIKMTTQSHRRRAVLALAVPLLIIAAGTGPAYADDMDPAPAPAPGPVLAPGPGPILPPMIGTGPATGVFIEVPAAPGPEEILRPWNIYQNTLTGNLTLGQDHPGYGWMQFSGPYATFEDGGADMNLFGVPGWEDF